MVRIKRLELNNDPGEQDAPMAPPAPEPTSDWLTEDHPVVVHLAFAFDIGDEIDLDQARQLLQGVLGKLPRRRRTPESIEYRPAPTRVPVSLEGFRLPGSFRAAGDPRGELTLFDFGAISLTARFPLVATPAELLELAGLLGDPAEMTEAARRLLAPWIERLKPAVLDFDVSPLSEEYVVFQLAEHRGDWLEKRADWIAGLVRLEPEPLSASEVREATRLWLSYTPDDLVVLDWAAGFVVDIDCADTLEVLEFANVQLLEFRHIDDRLDDRLEGSYRLIRPVRGRRWWWRGAWWNVHGEAVRRVRELELEATSVFERVDNSLKLIGDQYLVRVFELAAARFHLEGWQQSIRRKLETVGDVYDLLIQQAAGHRTEALEIIIILLIAVEIVLALIRY